MLNSNLNLDGSVVHRISFFLRSILALLAGHFISINGESQPFKELFKLPGYWPALLCSIIIAMVAIEQVNYSTIKLHKRLPVYDKEFVKLKRQIVFCLILPFMTIFTLAIAYYAYYGFFILDTMWVTHHGWQIIVMLLLLNVLFGVTRIKIVPKVLIPEPILNCEVLEKEIGYVSHENGFNKVSYKDGSHTLDIRSLDTIYKTLNKQLYRLNPLNSIVRLDSILIAYDIPGGKTKVEMITPVGGFVLVSGRQRQFYLGYFK